MVYKISNPTTDKFYIGRTRGSLKNRWRKHWLDAMRGSWCNLHSAIREFPYLEQWKTEVLYETPSAQEDRVIEKRLIMETRAHIIGYNMKT
jgi:hypothetical protein